MTLQEAFERLNIQPPQALVEKSEVLHWCVEIRGYKGPKNESIIGSLAYGFVGNTAHWFPCRRVTNGDLLCIQRKEEDGGGTRPYVDPRQALSELVSHFIAEPHVEGKPYELVSVKEEQEEKLAQTPEGGNRPPAANVVVLMNTLVAKHPQAEHGPISPIIAGDLSEGCLVSCRMGQALLASEFEDENKDVQALLDELDAIPEADRYAKA